MEYSWIDGTERDNDDEINNEDDDDDTDASN